MMDDENDDFTADSDSEVVTSAAEVIQKLKEVWMNEKLAPDLLPYEGELVECLLDQIQHMENSLQSIEREDFRIVFHKMELDRLKYIVSSYLRTRLEKIEKFGAHLLHCENQPTYTSLMSDQERNFAHKYVSSMSNYLQDTALKNMPANMQSLKLEEIGSKPQLDKSVFIKVKRDCKGIPIESFADYGEEEVVDLDADSQHILRYKPIVTLLKDGLVHLI